jgi:uncharacterized membrane protein
MPKINWTIRKQNPMFYIQVILSVFVPVLAYLGINWSDVTTWGTFFHVIVAAVSNPYCLSIVAVSLFNTVVDTSSMGVSDSKHVLCLKCIFDDCEEHEHDNEPEKKE